MPGECTTQARAKPTPCPRWASPRPTSAPDLGRCRPQPIGAERALERGLCHPRLTSRLSSSGRLLRYLLSQLQQPSITNGGAAIQCDAAAVDRARSADKASYGDQVSCCWLRRRAITKKESERAEREQGAILLHAQRRCTPRPLPKAALDVAHLARPTVLPLARWLRARVRCLEAFGPVVPRAVACVFREQHGYDNGGGGQGDGAATTEDGGRREAVTAAVRAPSPSTPPSPPPSPPPSGSLH